LASAHPTPKPIPLLISAIEDASHRGGIVLDPFMGAASTMIAADRVGRRCYGLELDPRYVDLSLRRVKAATGIVPIHAATGLTFDEQEERAAAAFVPSPIMGDDHGQANRPG
jgi:DNA modification methylase